MIDFKKCKGTGKTKGYGCGAVVSVKKRRYGLGFSCGCYGNWLYNTPEGQDLVSKATLKATNPRRSLNNATAEAKKNKSLGYLLINTRTTCHDYIKKRDKGLPCISCDTDWTPDFQAGHYYKAELFSSIRYEEINIHGQCPRCNVFLDGNIFHYTPRLKKRIGSQAFLSLEIMSQNSKKDTLFKWDREKLKEINEYYRLKNQLLKDF